MTRILLLATTTGYQTRAFADAAARQDIELMLATDRCDQLPDPWRDAAVPIRFHRETESVDALIAATDRSPVEGILVVGDRPVVIAARVAAARGLSGHPPGAARISRDKRAMRECLAAAGLPVPWFQTFEIDRSLTSPKAMPSEGQAFPERGISEVSARGWGPARIEKCKSPAALAAQVSYPCVLKPIALSASRGVIRADNPRQFVDAWERIVRLLRSKDIRTRQDPATGMLQVEGFIAGLEYALEGLLDRGRLRVLAIFDKPDPLDGPFFEETIYVTPAALTEAERGAIEAGVAAAAAAMGLHHGPIHAECRLNASGVFVLEVAARPIGGLCARCLRFEGPEPETWSLEDLLIAHAIGRPVDGWRREAHASGVMMIPVPGAGMYRGVEGLDEAETVPGITSVEITAKIDQRFVPLPEGASYPGFIFARGATSREVVASLRQAHARLRFRVDREWPVIR